MFALSFKISPKKIAVFCVAIAVVAYGATILKDNINQKVAETSIVTQDTKLKLPKVKNNEDRLKVIESLGWEVMNEPEEIEEILIPENFDDVYEKYNLVQKDMGYDLSKYKGKKCKRYIYCVKNHPDKEDVMLSLLVYKDRIIGGDVHTQELDGFMQSLKFK